VDLKLHYVVTEKTNDSKIIRRSGIRNAHSLIANFLSLLGYGNYSCSGTPGYYGIFVNQSSEYAIANTTYGIVVGTGSQTKSVLLRDLQNPITPSSTGLSYGNESYSGPVAINNNASAVLREIRSFVNNGTTSISLSEIGIYGGTRYFGSLLSGFNAWNTSNAFGSDHVLLAYDLLSPPVAVQPSQTVTFEYDWVVNV
jgi:hypothetical protein